GGDVGQRQADSRDDGGGYAAGDRSLPLFRGRDSGAGGIDLGDRREHDCVSLSRAAGGGGADYSVELSDFDGDVEAGAGAGGRELRGAEAGGADADVDPGADGADSGHSAAGRAEYREWLWAGGGQAAGFESEGREDCVYRGDDDGAADYAVCLAEPDSGDAGA